MAGGVSLWPLNEVSRVLLSVMRKYSHKDVLCAVWSDHVKVIDSIFDATE